MVVSASTSDKEAHPRRRRGRGRGARHGPGRLPSPRVEHRRTRPPCRQFPHAKTTVSNHLSSVSPPTSLLSRHNIAGGTGPVLAFTEILYKISVSLDVPFLALNAWIGIWVAAYMVLAAVVDLNQCIVLCTRFTDEIFSFLIALIFIINAVGSPFSDVGVVHYFDFAHKSHDPYGDDPYYSHWASALLSLVLFLGTMQLAFLLRKFKFSPFLPNQTLRNSMTDFAVVISILIWSLVGNAFPEIPVEKLNVSSSFQPTFQCCDAACRTSWPNECEGQGAPYGFRPWLVDLSDLNGKNWIPAMAAGPGELDCCVRLPRSRSPLQASIAALWIVASYDRDLDLGRGRIVPGRGRIVVSSAENIEPVALPPPGERSLLLIFSRVPLPTAALLAFVLVFLDDGITWHLINHPSHKLKHGDAYN